MYFYQKRIRYKSIVWSKRSVKKMTFFWSAIDTNFFYFSIYLIHYFIISIWPHENSTNILNLIKVSKSVFSFAGLAAYSINERKWPGPKVSLNKAVTTECCGLEEKTVYVFKVQGL